MKYLSFLAILIATLFAGVPAQESTSVQVSNGQEKAMNDSGITIRFLEVIEDSRCPSDVNCVWAGVARIRLRISKGGTTGGEFEVNTNQGDKPAIFDGWEIRLKKLDPYPSSRSTIKPSDYVATFSIMKSPKDEGPAD